MSVTEPLPKEAAPASAVAEAQAPNTPEAHSEPPTGSEISNLMAETAQPTLQSADSSVSTQAEPTPEANDGASAAEAPAGTDPAARAPGLSPAQTAAQLAERFPALFGGPPKPIKLRIQSDIQARAPGVFTKRVMSIVLSRHTTTTPYLKALVAETQRFDLDGQPAGEIDPVHKQAAVEELARRRQIVEARRAAERAARGPRTDAGPGQRPGPQTGPRPDRRRGGPEAVTESPTTETSAPASADGAPVPFRERPMRAQPPKRPGRPGGDQTDRPDRPGPRHDRPARQRPNPRAEHAAEARGEVRHGRPLDRGPRGPQGPGNDRPAARPLAAAPREWTPTDPQQRERAVLLRAWETSSLTKANFCALKRLTEAEFDAQLEQARQERSATRGA